MNNNYPFELIPLPYSYDALEPFIDEKTMRIHHDMHLQAYVNNLNAALKDYPEYHNWSLEQLLYNADSLPLSIRTTVINNGGGIYNHNFYFANLNNPETAQTAPTTDLMYAINQTFGSFEAFKDKFKKQALSVFGSGYTWLVVGLHGELQIINTKNQDTVLPLNAWPIIGIDVWEHAYYLKHYNDRVNYIDNWFKTVNMAQAQQNYLKYGGI